MNISQVLLGNEQLRRIAHSEDIEADNFICIRLELHRKAKILHWTGFLDVFNDQTLKCSIAQVRLSKYGTKLDYHINQIKQSHRDSMHVMAAVRQGRRIASQDVERPILGRKSHSGTTDKKTEEDEKKWPPRDDR
ncbi:hypothetical protein MJO28_013216 [Puccinia striiformis f. sp. tritici]|uniref:Uncharacterized protein n=1 Tax=Puccinia striiformis f. sp. tritici TaxID=168172 RepID=A0ACC0DXW5_9BASI|nr:hypothetical protein MJO28_013216 [Puccinia striiformis f. sp. tritici]